MKKTLLILTVLLLQGCAGLTGLIPSFWDDNQSVKIVDVRLSLERLDCGQPQAAQLKSVRDNILWFQLYSTSKGSRQADVVKLTQPLSETVEEWYKRVSAEGYKENKIYCDMKKKIAEEQAARAAKAILGRF
jgi:hypothetical protein